MIRIENLSVSYKETLALKDISLVLHGPTITGIIGPNGAGKSTLLKGMLGIIPHQGQAFLDDKEVKNPYTELPMSNKNQYRLQLSHQGQGMRLVRTISLYSSLSKFKD